MAGHVIDCCSLLNLLTGWRSLSPLSDLNKTWYICAAVLAESQYTREIGNDGKPVLVPLDLKPSVDAGILQPAVPETEQELIDYVSFAVDVDDGEAQALAIAKNRGFVLLTDDKKALKLATQQGVATISTIQVLREWGALSAENEARLPEVIRRISTLASFAPPAGSADHAWWQQKYES